MRLVLLLIIAFLHTSCDRVTTSCYYLFNTLGLPCHVKLYNQVNADSIVFILEPGSKTKIECPYRNSGDEEFDKVEHVQKQYRSIILYLNDSTVSKKDLRAEEEWNFTRNDKNNGDYTLFIDSTDF